MGEIFQLGPAVLIINEVLIKKVDHISKSNYILYTLGILDMENPVHKYLLHFIFVPRINHVIESFVKG